MIDTGLGAIASLITGALGIQNREWVYTPACSNAAYSNANITGQQQAYLQWLCSSNPYVKPPDPGIYWERTGGKTHRLTIVRTP